MFAFAGFTLPPAEAAVAMSLSTVIVAANAQLLRRVDLRATSVSSRASMVTERTKEPGARDPQLRHGVVDCPSSQIVNQLVAPKEIP